MSHLLGFILAIGLVRGAIFLLHMEISYYFDTVALLIVVGGTCCAAIITYPVNDLLRMVQAFFRIAKKTPAHREITVQQLVTLAVSASRSPMALLEAARGKNLNPFLKDGIDLIVSGFSREDLESIMTERMYRDREREEAFGNLLRTLSKYPPAFGLVGTVLGLVSVMRTVSSGVGAAQVGLQMALALVATFYGLILTNFVLVPMSENLYNKSSLNMGHRELMLEGLMLIYDKRSPVVVQEKLNSFLPPLKRKDLLGLNKSPEARGAA